MDYTILLTIVVPTYNSEQHIVRCLASITSQTFEHYEVLVIDGASTDNTVETVDACSKFDGRIRSVVEQDKGIYDAMNKGIALAKGQWLLFLGSDDELYANDVLQKIAPVITAGSADFIYGDVHITGDASWASDGTIYDGAFTIEKLFKRNVCHQSIFYRRTVFNSVGKFNINYTICADWDLNHRCFASVKTSYTPHIISRFYAGGYSTHRNHDLFTDRDCVFNLKKYYRISFFNKLFRGYWQIFYNMANEALAGKDYLKSSYYFGVSVFHSESKYHITRAFASKLVKSFIISTVKR